MKWKKVAEVLAKTMNDMGDCPLDRFDHAPWDCEVQCERISAMNNDTTECWIQWAKTEAESK